MFGVNNEIGRRKDQKKITNSLSLGLAYLNHNEVMTATVDFSGSIINKEIEMRHYIMPNINYELSYYLSEEWNLFTKLTYVRKLSFTRPIVNQVYLQIGLSFNLYTEEYE